ncbi:MAG TPA: hypothetical protein VMF30_08445 [Pirellulales bacterium]|nr:hypothetical protein [Pirellulales bacterium]
MWQSFVRNWLIGKLQQGVGEQLRGAAARSAGNAPGEQGQQTSPAIGHPVPTQPIACHVGVVCGTRAEAAGLLARMDGVVETQGDGFSAHEGSLAGRRVVTIVTGEGAAATRRGTLALGAGHRPQWIVAAGFATALVPGLRVGDIIMADRLSHENGSEKLGGANELAVDFQIDAAALTASPHLRVGRLLTVDRLPTDSRTKQILAQRYQAVGADRQSAAVAEVCRLQRLRFLAISAIREPCESLTAEVDNLSRQRTWPGRFGAVAAAMVRRPSSLPEMWQRTEDALVAGERLGQFLAGVIRQLD